MKSKSVLISGATGFIGSHIAEVLSKNDYKVLLLIRNQSNLWRLGEIDNKNQILINLDENDYKNEIAKHKPICFIHSAWQGVAAKDRDNWITQFNNLSFTIELLSLAKAIGIKKVIALGSQAEYGNFEGRISEDAICKPTTAYGAAKHITQIALESFCTAHSISWYWLRLFSLYGERESETWLIPSLIKNLLSEKPMDLTLCDQHYDYMYAGDFAIALKKVIEVDSESGIFNLTSNSSIKLKKLINEIRIRLKPNAILNFGALPYRPNQVMHMEGNSLKFVDTFNFPLNSNIEKQLSNVINYYTNKFINAN